MIPSGGCESCGSAAIQGSGRWCWRAIALLGCEKWAPRDPKAAWRRSSSEFSSDPGREFRRVPGPRIRGRVERGSTRASALGLTLLELAISTAPMRLAGRSRECPPHRYPADAVRHRVRRPAAVRCLYPKQAGRRCRFVKRSADISLSALLFTSPESTPASVHSTTDIDTVVVRLARADEATDWTGVPNVFSVLSELRGSAAA